MPAAHRSRTAPQTEPDMGQYLMLRVVSMKAIKLTQTYMADTDDSTHNMLQYAIFALLLLIGLSPFMLMLWKNSAYRQRLVDTFCCRDCKDCCTRRVHYDEADLRTLRELEQPQRESVGINGAYRMYQARRSRLSLRLASWREDVKRGGGNDDRLHHKLAQIQAAHFRRQQTQPVASSGTTTAAAATNHRANSTPNLPFDIRVVEINDRVDESNSSSAASAVAVSSNSLDEESVYELVPPTPKEKRTVDSVRIGRRSAVTAEEEEEEKEDVPPRDHEIV
ncbi:hypothetical protein BBJ29_002980 [Phytophthora kernoviae]|uniref:Uncharacterized protein n=1 Tax=Phytophthora kernoviae TaxID=325452 RepID=A0A3F2RUB0_9STRA|nr:hypothetical protein BBJ29_002980 [Phytophthora kernoviae]RLN64400.1 hypothetical protein BBP00_00003494 [Phytophthora kernoviae]